MRSSNLGTASHAFTNHNQKAYVSLKLEVLEGYEQVPVLSLGFFSPSLTRYINIGFFYISFITHHLHQMLGSHHLERSAQHLLLWYGGQGWTRIPQLLFHLVLFPLSISSYKSITDSFQEQDVIYMHRFSNPHFTP